MSPADLPHAEVMCLEIQIAREAEGFRVADQVKTGSKTGVIISFACHDMQPGAWVMWAVPGSVRGAIELRRVTLAELRRVKP